MGQTKSYPPCVQVVAGFSQDRSALDWLWQHVERAWGPILQASPIFQFVESKYYEKSMGQGLLKQIVVLERWYDPGKLSACKLESNLWELEFKGTSELLVDRPLNIDPGYMSMTKLVLASTKNREHRLYLDEGIYAEVTLAFRDQVWHPMPWTYADFQRNDVRDFLAQARKQFAARVACMQQSGETNSQISERS